MNTALPVVFTGVDADPSKYGYPAANVTGVIERPHFKESLALAQRLRPIKRIAVLSCHDSTSILALGFMKQEQLDVEVAEWLMVDDFDDWKKAVERFNHSVDAIVIRSYQAVKKPGSVENMAPRRRCRVDLRARHHSDDRLSRLRDRRWPAGGGRQVGARVWSNTGGVRPPHPCGNASEFAAHRQAKTRHQDDQPHHRAAIGDLLRKQDAKRRDSRFQGLSHDPTTDIAFDCGHVILAAVLATAIGVRSYVRRQADYQNLGSQNALLGARHHAVRPGESG